MLKKVFPCFYNEALLQCSFKQKAHIIMRCLPLANSIYTSRTTWLSGCLCPSCLFGSRLTLYYSFNRLVFYLPPSSLQNIESTTPTQASGYNAQCFALYVLIRGKAVGFNTLCYNAERTLRSNRVLNPPHE